jgi:ABC-2 type transport system permease protein
VSTLVGADGGGSGAVYDRGYRPYDGPRGGRRASRSALYRASLRRALGLRRSWRQKVAPFVLLGIAVIPAIVNVGVKYLTRNTPANDIEFFTYREYVGVSNTLLVFVALTAPDLFCPDRRQHVLPLYFARPLTGIDYVLAKTGALFSILFAFSFLPQVVLYVGNLFVNEDGALTYFKAHTDVLWKVPVSVLILSLLFALIGAALASLTTRRISAGASIVGVFLVSSIVSSVLIGDSEAFDYHGSPAALINVLGIPLNLRDVVFLGHVDPESPLSGVANGGVLAGIVYAALVLATVVTLVMRYREVER